MARARARLQQRKPPVGDATVVYDRSKGRRPAGAEPPRLVVTAGPGRGTEHVLLDDRTTIGRSPDSVLVIPDISVSRRHARLERQGERWVVLDQGSGNGTLVNGRRVDRHPLQHGDEIGMGDTRVQFVEPGGVLVRGTASSPAARADAPRSGLRRRGPLYGAILCALAIVLAAGLVRRRQRLRIEAEEEQGDESRAFARKRFQEGVALIRQGKWVEARDRLKIAAQLDDQDPEIRRSLESAESEAPRARQLSAARLALLRRDYAGARTALSGIPDGSALAESARELSLLLQAGLDSEVRQARALAVKAAIARQRRAALERRRKKAARPAAEPPEAARGIPQEEESRPGPEERKALSAMHYATGAAQAESDETLPAAAAHLRTAVENDPGNDAAQALLRHIQERCKEIYLRGYAAKDQDADAARRAFELVLQTLPDSDETAQKARRWLDKLDGKHPQGE